MKCKSLIIFIIASTLFVGIAHTQTTHNPYVASSNNNNIIEKIAITNTETIVYLKCPRVRLIGAWLSFSSATVIFPSGDWNVNELRSMRLDYPEFSGGTEYINLYKEAYQRVSEGRQLMSDLGLLIRNLGPDKLDQKYKANQKDRDFYYFELHFDKLPEGIEEIHIRELVGEGGFEWLGVKINNPFPTVPHIISSESSLKRNIDENNDGITGIYDGFDSQGYKLACIWDNGAYKLIYMDSKKKYSHWRKGDVKAILTKSATPGFFKAQWYMYDKTINHDTYVMFKGGSMDVVIDEEESSYLKMYPTKVTSVSPSSSDVDLWTGTGFALNDGYIVTNYHVIEDAKTISIKGVNGDFDKNYNGMVVGSDKHNDLTLIKITDNNFNGFDQIPYKIKTSLSDVGEDVFVLGYPLTTTMGDEIKLTTGVVSSKTGFQGDITLYQISAPIQPGNSGGPLFDNNGNVIGIVNAKHNGADNVGYAIKSMYLRNLIENVVSSSIIPINNHISTKTLPEKVKSLNDYIFLIECSSGSTFNDNTNTTNRQTQTKPSNTYFAGSYSYKSRQSDCIITNIEATNSNTVVSFCYTNNDYEYGGWCSIDPSVYLIYYNGSDGTKLNLQKADNIPTSPNKHNFKHKGEKLEFKLYFPPLPNNIDGFDIIESLDSEWQWVNIHQ